MFNHTMAPSDLPMDNSSICIETICTMLEAREKARTWGVSHFLGRQECTVTYGNKHNIGLFER